MLNQEEQLQLERVQSAFNCQYLISLAETELAFYQSKIPEKDGYLRKMQQKIKNKEAKLEAVSHTMKKLRAKRKVLRKGYHEITNQLKQFCAKTESLIQERVEVQAKNSRLYNECTTLEQELKKCLHWQQVTERLKVERKEVQEEKQELQLRIQYRTSKMATPCSAKLSLLKKKAELQEKAYLLEEEADGIAEQYRLLSADDARIEEEARKANHKRAKLAELRQTAKQLQREIAKNKDDIARKESLLQQNLLKEKEALTYRVIESEADDPVDRICEINPPGTEQIQRLISRYQSIKDSHF